MTPVYDGYPVSAVEALIDHQIAGTLGGDAVAYCACGWKSIDEAPLWAAWAAHAQHLIDIPAAAGYRLERNENWHPNG